MVAIETEYRGPTDTRGSHILVRAGDCPAKRYSYDYAAQCPHDSAVREYCRDMGWQGRLIKGGTKRGYVYVFAQSDSIVLERVSETPTS